MDKAVRIFGPSFSTFVRSVMIACEEKGISYEVGTQFDGKELSFGDNALFQLHPFGKVPVLITEQGKIRETASIIRFLDAINDDNNLYPQDAFGRAEVDQWSALISVYVDQAIVRDLLLEYAFPKGEGGSVRQDKVAEALPSVHNALQVVRDQLVDKDYICGEQLSAADLVLIPMLDYLLKTPNGNELFAEYPKVHEYLNRISKRPSVAKVIAA